MQRVWNDYNDLIDPRFPVSTPAETAQMETFAREGFDTSYPSALISHMEAQRGTA